MYEIYTLPSCEKCKELVSLFKEKGVGFEEINLVSCEGRTRLRGLLKNYREEVKRECGGMLILPLIFFQDSGEEKKYKVYQGEEGIEVLVKNENISLS